MKKKVVVLAGGNSSEHQISLISAYNVCCHLDKNAFDVTVVGIDLSGAFSYYDDLNFVEYPDDPKRVKLKAGGVPVVLSPKPVEQGAEFLSLTDNTIRFGVDVVFPVLHGPNGEDGRLQGLLSFYGVSYVGCGVDGSVIGMDKDLSKKFLRDANIPVVPWLLARHKKDFNYQEIVKQLGAQCFVKPARQGSSLGVSRVTDEDSYLAALDLAFTCDNKVLIEQEFKGQEIECAVLGIAGQQAAEASVLGEVVLDGGFYSYEEKYLGGKGDSSQSKGTSLVVPANVSPALSQRIQKMAIEAFVAIEGRGLSRIDFLVDATAKGQEKIVVNEINTLPGFTSISMYPRLWQASGLSYKDLLTRLVLLAQKN